MRPSQNPPLPPRIYPHFQQIYATLPESTPPSQNIPPPFLVTIFDYHRIYPSLPEYTPLFYTYVRPSQNLPLPPRIYPLPFYFLATIMRPSQNLPLPPRIYPPFQQLYATLLESTPPSQNIPPHYLVTVCNPPRI